MVFGGLWQEAQAAGQALGEEVTRFWNQLARADREQRLARLCWLRCGWPEALNRR